MRALFFLETPHRLGGAPRSLLATLTRLPAFGVKPIAVFPAEGSVEELFRANGVETRIVPAPEALLLFNKQLLALSKAEQLRVLVSDLLPYNLEIARLVRLLRADVVHFNTPRGILVAGLAARLARRPTCLHVRGATDFLAKPLWTACQVLADRIVLVARALEPDVMRPFRHKATVVYNGIAALNPPDKVTARRTLAERLGRPEIATGERVLVVSLSSYTPFKGLHHLFSATAMARARGAPIHVVCAGGGNDARYRDYLVRLRTELELESTIDIIGFSNDPLTILAAADVLVLPTVLRERLTIGQDVLEVRCSEGLPRSILEAMALGVPCIATDVAGVREQLDHRVTGLVVPPGDAESLARALCEAASNATWRLDAGARAREVVRERFSLDIAAQGLANVLGSLASAAS
ncbi:MAG: glycosyltransferase family 4 protein [Pseudomonadota bacterium]|nr:MAG: hypothetical protein DIU78_03115 [Pseudomonadota bacterium]